MDGMFRTGSSDLTEFLLSADSFREEYSVSSESGSEFGGAFGMPGIPLPGPGDAVRRIDSRTAVMGAAEIAAQAQATDRRASQAAVAELDLSLTLESIRRVMDLAERSRLGGIPLFRPRHATSEVLPLYDFTNAGNLEELEELSGISLPRTFGREVSDEEALRLREAMRADERIEVREDTLSARRGVLALFGADVEDAVAFMKAPPPAAGPVPPVPPGSVRFTLTTKTANITVDYWPHAVRKRAQQMADRTDAACRTTHVMRCGNYGFSTRDLSWPPGVDDTGSHGVWPHSPTGSTSRF